MSGDQSKTLLAELLSLQHAEALAEVAFMELLGAAETRPDVWHRFGYESFETLLASGELCDAERYVYFKTVTARYGVERVRALGLDAVEDKCAGGAS